MTRSLSAVRIQHYRGGQLLALLLVAVVVPSACVLWFMNEAVTSQAAAARRSVDEAYRGQLRLLRGRLVAYWESRAADLESNLTRNAGSDFKRLVTGGAVDSVVVLEHDGTGPYPSLVFQPDVAGTRISAGSAAARVAQEIVRNLVQAGDRTAAIDAINRYFMTGPAARGLDPEGRLIAADAQLLLIDLLPRADRRRAMAVEKLSELLNDYSKTTISSAQRVFLMNEIRSAAARTAPIQFPTLDAERLAIAFLEAERPARGATALRPTATRDLWQISSPGTRVVALLRTGTVMRGMRTILEENASPSVSFAVTEPGAATDHESIAIGSALPGWEISFAATDRSPVAVQAGGRRNAYLSIALLAIGVIVVAVATIGSAARRQARLASLKTDLVAAVSHELKTPLSSMRLLVDALLEDKDLDPVKTRDYLRLMAVENARLSRLIENFLTFSRLERSRHQFSFKATDPSDVVREAVETLPEGRRGDRGPALAIAPDLPSIVADHDALVTVLLNLLDNAYKYTPADGRILLRAFREQDEVVFAVEDNGIGIPPREQKRIFQRFYRVDQGLARETGGSGLGLSIVDAIVRAHGGRVRVQSRPELGSTFSVYLPCATDGARA